MILKHDIGFVPDDMVDLDVVPEELDNVFVGDLSNKLNMQLHCGDQFSVC